MNRLLSKWIAALMCLMCIFPACMCNICAAETVDPAAEVSLILTFRSGKTPIPCAEFSLYRVADAELVPCGEFSGYEGKLGGFDEAEQWDDAAAQLQQFAKDAQAKPLATGKTDSKGELSFSEGMTAGVYLLVSGQTEYNGETYTAKPALLCLPQYEDDAWNYDVRLNVKAGSPATPPGPNPPTPPTDPRLPKTGLLWWPVPALAAMGLLFLVIGVVRRRSYRDET